MDISQISFDWSRARAFLATAETGSLSAAARALGLAQPTLGRQVAQLEEDLGLALFDRTGRALVLTPAGRALLPRARAMAEAALAFSRAAAGLSDQIDGRVVLTASEFYAAFRLPPVIAALQAAHPGIEVEVRASNDVSDLARREADIALRNTRPEDPKLIGRRLADDEGYFYGSASYVASLGTVTGPADLASARFLAWDQGPALADLLTGMAVPLGPHSFPVTTGSHLVQWQMTQAGLGLAAFPRAEGDAHLTRVAHLAPVPFPVWLVAHRDLAHSKRLRLVWDLLAAMLPRAAGPSAGP
ncbi:LysR family transcriptional regulator [Pseudooceanicola marinus]|uniref:LysR family transcriptional regulator n=1 Tax=Pseudooceanicola marinus TaxID=396013 RepID=UPI001CD45271|nr:LysR family transcriptional regulator [Pseudooceanicola marinus]MCA1337667.1 LysR family transcriptional regulator [Pseudooceanicola marinus]